MDLAFLGLDVSKNTVHAVLLDGERKQWLEFANSPDGFSKLMGWLTKHATRPVHACMEATGSYSEALALFLSGKAWRVSVVNPRMMKHYAISCGGRTKTDAYDAGVIANYCRTQEPREWRPPAPERLALRALVRRREDLVQMIAAEKSRAEAPGVTGPTQSSIEKHVAYLEQAIEDLDAEIKALIARDPEMDGMRKLLLTIPGVGETTAVIWIAEIGDCSDFRSAREVAAYLGLTPQHHSSGTSVWRRPRMSKAGNPFVRKSLFFPALSAASHCPHLADFRKRKLRENKRPAVIIGAVMRKLAHTIFGVLRSGMPYDPSIPLRGALTTQHSI
jgi:transposase